MVTLKLREKDYTLPGGIPLSQAFKRLGLDMGSHLAVCEGEIITEDRVLQDGDVIKLIPVISGGSQ